METNFLKTNEIVETAVSRRVIPSTDRLEFKAYLGALDVALDNRMDGGFGIRQIQKDAYFSVDNKFAKNDLARIRQINRLIYTMFHEPTGQTRPSTLIDAALFTFGSIILMPFMTSGCAGNEYHSCVNLNLKCPDNDACYYDNTDTERCGCKQFMTSLSCDEYGCACECSGGYHNVCSTEDGKQSCQCIKSGDIP